MCIDCCDAACCAAVLCSTLTHAYLSTSLPSPHTPILLFCLGSAGGNKDRRVLAAVAILADTEPGTPAHDKAIAALREAEELKRNSSEGKAKGGK